ncbi:MAG: hypothetical protein H6641_07840 [Caldilineaceae bacterium]|nr:hypothetical protein [Caldilineaceae bacterium]
MSAIIENTTSRERIHGDQIDNVEARRVQQLCADVRALMVRKKEQIYAEIRAYPFPIPACDAQYNYLLEKRDRASQELQQLDALAAAQANPAATLAALKAVVAESALLDKETRWRLISA